MKSLVNLVLFSGSQAQTKGLRYASSGGSRAKFRPLKRLGFTNCGTNATDMVHNIIVTNLSIGIYTPPFGLCLFVSCKVLKVNFSECVRGTLPFMILALIALLIVTFVPAISTGLPALLYPVR